MRNAILVGAATVFLLGCRGEPVPRDYQDSSPRHAATSSQKTPSAAGMPAPAPESTAAEGKSNGKPIDPTSPSTTLKDQAPSNAPGTPPANNRPATQTTSTAATGTHLAIRP